VGELRLGRELFAVGDEPEVDRLGEPRGDLLGTAGGGQRSDQGCGVDDDLLGSLAGPAPTEPAAT